MTDRKDKKTDQQVTGSVHKEARRKALKSTLIGGAVISTSVVPEKWKKPMLDSVVLPSHATTTDDSSSAGGANTTPGAAPTPAPTTTMVYVTTTCSPNANCSFKFTFSDWVDEEIKVS